MGRLVHQYLVQRGCLVPRTCCGDIALSPCVGAEEEAGVLRGRITGALPPPQHLGSTSDSPGMQKLARAAERKGVSRSPTRLPAGRAMQPLPAPCGCPTRHASGRGLTPRVHPWRPLLLPGCPPYAPLLRRAGPCCCCGAPGYEQAHDWRRQPSSWCQACCPRRGLFSGSGVLLDFVAGRRRGRQGQWPRVLRR